MGHPMLHIELVTTADNLWQCHAQCYRISDVLISLHSSDCPAGPSTYILAQARQLMVKRSNRADSHQEVMTHFLQLSHGHLLPLHLWQLLSRGSCISRTVAPCHISYTLSSYHLSCYVWDLANMVRVTVIKGGLRAFPLCTCNFACKALHAFDTYHLAHKAKASTIQHARSR